MNAIPAVSILGVGAVTPLGRDLESIRDSILSMESAPSGRPLNGDVQIRRVDDNLLVDPATATQLRRADRFTRMAFLAAADAWNAAGKFREGIGAERIGLILSSGFGPHCAGLNFWMACWMPATPPHHPRIFRIRFTAQPARTSLDCSTSAGPHSTLPILKSASRKPSAWLNAG